MPFDYTIDFKTTDFRKHPELYRVGKGEQGVLSVEPYKSEILPYWRFKDPETAQASAEHIFQLFITYLENLDFIGADMARKFLQMGFTRARRYANHRSGRKYARNPQAERSPEQQKQAREKYLLPREEDPVKAAAALIFKQKWEEAKNHPDYQAQKKLHEQKYGK
jgi:hypothetical protein